MANRTPLWRSQAWVHGCLGLMPAWGREYMGQMVTNIYSPQPQEISTVTYPFISQHVNVQQETT